MHLGGTGLAEHPHQGPLGVAPHDRVVDDDQPLAFDDFAQRVQLEPDAALAQRLARLDERAAHIGVLHQPLGERDAAAFGVAHGRGRARFGDGDDHVCIGRVLPGQPPPHFDAGAVDVASRDRGVGTGQVDVFEQAAFGLGRGETPGSDAVRVDDQQLSRFDLAHHGSTNDVEGGRLGGHDPPALGAAQDERSHALRVAGRVEGVLVHEDQGECALDFGQHVEGGFLGGAVRGGGEQTGEHLGVRGRAQAIRRQQRRELRGVDQVAVVAERETALPRAEERGLRVLPDG